MQKNMQKSDLKERVSKLLDKAGKWFVILLAVAAVSILVLLSLKWIAAPEFLVFIFQLTSFVSVVSSIFCLLACLFLSAAEIILYKKNWLWLVPFALVLISNDATLNAFFGNKGQLQTIEFLILVAWILAYWFVGRKRATTEIRTRVKG